MSVPGLRVLAGSPGSRVASVAASQPSTVLTANDLGNPFCKDANWVHSRTGIQSLRRLAGEDIIRHAQDAARDALSAAGLMATDVELLIVATCSASTPEDGALGPRLAAALGLHCAQFDINAACAGFSYALTAADTLIRAGSARCVLIVAAEQMSSVLDPTDLGTSILFGDAAGAAVVVPHEQPHIGPAVQGSDGSGRDVIAIDHGGALRMRGREVFRWAIETVPSTAREACRRAGIRTEQVDFLVLHQANLRIIESIRQRLALSTSVCVADDVTLSGNTSAASIPVALTHLRQQGRTRAGALALLIGYGAGLTYSAQVITLP